MTGHWLTVAAGNPRITGCNCGFTAHDSDDGYGDSVIRHLQAQALRDAANALPPAPPGMASGPVRDWLVTRANRLDKEAP